MMISQRYNEQMGNYLAKLAKASKPQTNADRIRSMTDEELAAFLNGTDGDFLPTGEALTVSAGEKRWLDWLKSPVEEGDNG